jgi:hypothetical protein
VRPFCHRRDRERDYDDGRGSTAAQATRARKKRRRKKRKKKNDDGVRDVASFDDVHACPTSLRRYHVAGTAAPSQEE